MTTVTFDPTAEGVLTDQTNEIIGREMLMD